MLISSHPRLLRFVLYFIAIIQFILGSVFLFMPEMAAQGLHLTQAPGWVNWLLGMMAARCLGFAYGLWVAAHDVTQARAWVVAMMVVQALDWVVTLKYLGLGAVTLMQVSTAAFLPVLFVVGLWISLPRKSHSLA